MLGGVWRGWPPWLIASGDDGRARAWQRVRRVSGRGGRRSVGGMGREEGLEVALGVAAVAMAAQAVGTDELREGGFDAGTGLQLLAEGRCLGLATAGDQAVVVLGDAQVAAALAAGAL